ncbi:MAG: ExbD/TolR family protein [Limnobacter sp.]|uniref:ExbD/TolR family protein n=1 Tax=Limnobacter sp. TaxID=2003368 RepID=UPI00391B7676
MGMNIGSNDDDSVISAINTTPLVDVMLVLLIIFLITVPVVVQTAKVNLPEEVNQARATKPEDINLAVDAQGRVFWNELYIREELDLLDRLKTASQKTPQPEVHVRGDQETSYEHIAKVILNVQRAGIAKVGFITIPPARN